MTQFRSRDEQVAALADLHEEVSPTRTGNESREYAEAFVKEAEARGAAEAQGKGCEIIWQVEADGGWINVNNPDRFRDRGFTLRSLHTRPANVAALEARVNELEGILSKLLDAISCTGSTEEPDVLIAEGEARAALKREGGV